MSQMTFSDYEYSLRKRKTKREEFLDIMNEIIPWEEWVEFVRPYYPNGKGGSLWAAAVRSTAVFTPSPEGRGQGVGQLCVELTMKNDKIDLRRFSQETLDIVNRIWYTERKVF